MRRFYLTPARTRARNGMDSFAKTYLRHRPRGRRSGRHSFVTVEHESWSSRAKNRSLAAPDCAVLQSWLSRLQIQSRPSAIPLDGKSLLLLMSELGIHLRKV